MRAPLDFPIQWIEHDIETSATPGTLQSSRPRSILALPHTESALGGAAEQLAVALESRAVAGAVPGLLRVVPRHDAPHVRADCGVEMQHASIIPECGSFPALHFEDFSFAGI